MACDSSVQIERMSGPPYLESRTLPAPLPPGITSYNTSRNRMHGVPPINLNESLSSSVKEYKKIRSELEAAVSHADAIDKRIKAGNTSISTAIAMYYDRMVNQKRIQVSRLQSDPNVKAYLQRHIGQNSPERSISMKPTIHGPSTIFKKRRGLRKTRRASRRNTTRRRR